jgi:hypothetical protein
MNVNLLNAVNALKAKEGSDVLDNPGANSEEAHIVLAAEYTKAIKLDPDDVWAYQFRA